MLFHEPWSMHVSREFMLKYGFHYSKEPLGRDKGSFNTIVKLAKRNVIKNMNVTAKAKHGYTINSTKTPSEPKFRRKMVSFILDFCIMVIVWNLILNCPATVVKLQGQKVKKYVVGFKNTKLILIFKWKEFKWSTKNTLSMCSINM